MESELRSFVYYCTIEVTHAKHIQVKITMYIYGAMFDKVKYCFTKTFGFYM